MDIPLRLLIIEDSERDVALEVRALEAAGYRVTYAVAETAAEMKAALIKQAFDIVISDHSLPQFDAPGALAVLKQSGLDIPFIIVSGFIGEETAVALMKAGAHDYIEKDKLSRLISVVRRELEEAESRRERKKAEGDLQKNERKYRLLAENIQDVVFVMDMNLNYTYLSPSVKLLRGYEPEEAMKHTPAETVTPSSMDLAIKILSGMLEIEKSGQIDVNISRTAELEMSRKDGTTVWVETKAFFARDENQRPVGIMGVTRDITERKRAEDVLKNSEEKYRTILENIEDGYYEVDIKGNFTFFNDSMCRILGYSQEEMMGINNRHFTDKENAKKLFKTFNEVYKTGKPAKEFGWEIIRKDGNKRYIAVSVSLQKNSSGESIGFRGIAHDITERKQMEETLRQSQEYFKEITENSSDIIIILDKKGDIKYCSRSIERFTGYKAEELIGKKGVTIIHQDDVKRAVDDFGKAILTKDSVIPNAFRIIHKDGSERYFEGLGKNLLDNPAVAGFIINVRDATDRKRSEEALHQSEEKYRTILESIYESYFEVDLAGNFTFVNDSMCRLTGCSKEELLGMNHRQFTNEEIAKEVFQAFNKVYTTGEPSKAFDWQVIRKDGVKLFIETSITLIKDSSGKPVGFKGVIRDITERKQAEEALKTSEHHYRVIFENAAEGISVVDPVTGGFMFCNPALCAMFGYTAEEFRELRVADLHPPGELERVQAEIEAVGRGEAGVHSLASCLRKGGVLFKAEISGSTMEVEGQRLVVGFFTDVTERTGVTRERSKISRHL